MHVMAPGQTKTFFCYFLLAFNSLFKTHLNYSLTYNTSYRVPHDDVARMHDVLCHMTVDNKIQC